MKKYLPLALLSILFVSLLFYLNNNNSLNFVENTPTLTAVVPTKEVETKWQTYRNEKYGFQFDYPTDWKLETYNNNRDVVSLKIIDDGSGFSDFSVSFVSTEPVLKYINTIKSNTESKNITETKFNGQTAYYVDICGHSYFTVLYFGNNNTMSIVLDNTQDQQHISPEISEILSSFRFLDENNCVEKEICTDGIDPKTGKIAGGCRKIQYCNGIEMKYSCPTGEWVDCMPGTGVVKPQCQPEYLKWANTNCPNFKGAAL